MNVRFLVGVAITSGPEHFRGTYERVHYHTGRTISSGVHERKRIERIEGISIVDRIRFLVLSSYQRSSQKNSYRKQGPGVEETRALLHFDNGWKLTKKGNDDYYFSEDNHVQNEPWNEGAEMDGESWLRVDAGEQQASDDTSPLNFRGMDASL